MDGADAERLADVTAQGMRMSPRSQRTFMSTSTTSGYITVANLSTAMEAHLIQGALHAAGIDALVPDANISQTHSLMTVALGGVRVVVPSDQADAAQEILDALNRGDLQLEGDEGEPAGGG